ncbi:hypothetical protein P2318_31695 [Myxococcaceae bacterium GXIMD 01537]
MEEWVRKTGRLPTEKEQRRWEKQARRAARREERERREQASRNPATGIVFALAALALVVLAISGPRERWWMIFIALGLGSTAAHHLYRPRVEGEAREDVALPAGEARRESPEVAEAEPLDPRTARVDALCGKLVTELRAAPGVLREVVSQPEQTVEALRKSCHELVRRERELRGLSSAEDDKRLADERAQLAARVEAEQDAVVKARFSAALEVLDEQRRQRAELATAASRLEAEHTRLYYTLENLYAQVLRVRSADSVSEDVAGTGLRKSLEQLGAEMDAVSEALEDVHRAPSDARVRTR